MMNLNELEQFTAFAKYGTLSRTAEVLNISQPTITRTMQHVEEEFGVTLFNRGKNKITLNETGEKAVECAKKLLEEAENTIRTVQAFDKSMHTIRVESCAPAPLWTLLPDITARYHENMISSRLLSDINEIIQHVRDGECDIGILPGAIERYVDGKECLENAMSEAELLRKEALETRIINNQEKETLVDVTYLREKLNVCISKEHELAQYEELSMDQLNGYNCLLRDQIGFWTNLCHQKMPASRFLVQTDEFAFEELIRSSTLFCFTTNFATDVNHLLKDRKVIPLTDQEVDVTYHLICRREKEEYIKIYR